MLDEEGALDRSWSLRCVMGGVLMGLANLVPGISGGTMLLAAGVYPRFIEAIADLSSLRIRKRSIWVLALIVASALGAIVLGAGPVKNAVVHQRWAMYSLFIGLTLGGVPILWKMARPAQGRFWVAALVALLGMIALAWMQMRGASAAAEREGFMMMFVAGVSGAAAMVLPGVSGGYLLLLLGVYLPILGAIDELKDAIKAGDLASVSAPFLQIILPVGAGVLVGVLIISNLIKVLLEKYEQPTLGALLGLLVGAVFGLWPFQRGVAPKLGDTFKGQLVTPEILAEISPAKYPTEIYAPGWTDVLLSLALIALGFAITSFVARIGNAQERG